MSINNIEDALTKRLYHTITLWNRLEGRPRKDDFERALKAEIRDPLWMLTRQWQMGEFNGDDAGSPVGSKIHMGSTRLNKYKASDHPARAFNNDVPLEATVEQRPIPFEFEKLPYLLDIRLMMGRQWIRMLSKTIGNQTDYYISKGYSVSAPDDPDKKEDAYILAHPEVWQKFAAAAGRQIDGYKIYQAIVEGTNPGAGHPNEAEINATASDFKKWVENFFLQPDNVNENAWLPSRLEYQFSCSAPRESQEVIYEAEEYYSGRLDWFNFRINDDKNSLGNPEGVITEVEDTSTRSSMPAAIDFGGMPNLRWWTFEDSKTYLGDIKPNTVDIGKLLFSEFVLIYANDWFILPQKLPANTISKVKGLVVTNVFGERTWIQPTGKGLDDEWQRWTMFTLSKKGKDLKEADNSLLLLPTVPKIQESPPMEQFVMIRDEVANMVWAIETDITLASGRKTKAAEAARELEAFYKRLVSGNGGATTETNEETIASIRYKIMNSVPENWIPFIPVHIDENNREIQLQRAAMPRLIEGEEGKPDRIRPRSILLREGLDKDSKKAYFIHEEEVPRAGTLVSQSFQRTRWYGGRVVNWLGIHKKTGRGEGASGLKFDYLKNI